MLRAAGVLVMLFPLLLPTWAFGEARSTEASKKYELIYGAELMTPAERAAYRREAAAPDPASRASAA